MAGQALDKLNFASKQTIDLFGNAVELFVAGDGPPLLFLHGLDGVEGAAPLIRELAQSYRVYAPSHPGFGESALPSGTNRVDDLGYFYLDLLDELGLEKPLVVGTSFGAWVAAEILTKEKDRASGLLMISPFGLPTANRREQDVADIFMMGRQDLNSRIGLDEVPATEEDDEDLRREMRRDEALSLYAWTPYMHNPKLAGRLHRIDCPVTIVWGDKDDIIGPAYRDRFAEALPKAKNLTIADAGHALHSERAEQVAALVGELTNNDSTQEVCA